MSPDASPEKVWVNRLVWGQAALLLGFMLVHRLGSGAGGLLARLDLEGWVAVLVLALITLNMWAWVQASPPERSRMGRLGLVLLAALIVIGLLIGVRVDIIQILSLPLLSLAALAGARAVVDRPAALWVGLAALLGIAFYLPLTHLERSGLPGWLQMALGLGMGLLPGLATAVAALLLAGALRASVQQASGLLVTGMPHPEQPAPAALRASVQQASGLLVTGTPHPEQPAPAALSSAEDSHTHAGGVRYTGLRLGLAGLLLAALVYSLYWAAAWDQTSDGLSGLFFAGQAVMGALWAAMLLSNSGGRRARLVGAGFAVVVPLLMIAGFGRGQALPYQELTERRAARVEVALESFHARHGRYPAQLGELALRELLVVPRPMIFYSEGWCYQGGPDFYRLGAFYREYFSTPLSLRVFAAAGVPNQQWECAARLAEMQARYDPRPVGASQP